MGHYLAPTTVAEGSLHTHHEDCVDGGDLEGHWVVVRHARFVVVGGVQVVADLGVIVQPL